MESMDTTLDQLVQKAEELTAEIDGESDLPRVERNLRQLLEAGEKLWQRTASGISESSDVRASVLLGSKGYDLQKVTQHLDSLSCAKRVAPVESIPETDIKGFLRSERENAMLAIIEEVRKATIRTTDQIYMQNMEHEWEQEKTKILNALIGPDDDLTDFEANFDVNALRSQATASPQLTPRPRLYFEPSFIDTKSITALNSAETAFAKEIIKFVDQIIHGGIRINVANIFYEKVAKEIIGEPLIIELWEMINTLLSNDLGPSGGQDPLSLRSSSVFQLHIIKQARLFLEKKCRESMQGIVFGETRSITESPSAIYNLVKNYLNAKTPSWINTSLNTSFGVNTNNSEDGCVDGHPIWCFVWHCLRAGSVDAAIDVVQKGPHSLNVPEFVAILREYRQSEDRRLSQKLENQIRIQYKKSIRLSPDIYKRAVYSLLGCCGINDLHADIIDKVDDFLWLRLGQIELHEREAEVFESSVLSSSLASDRLTLTKLQIQISEEYGESHFNAQEKPFTYFKVLFLTGQFESAIEFLFRVDRYRCHAVHIAISLHELGLLLLPQMPLKVPLISKQSNDPPNIKRLNFAKLITNYTKKFESNNWTEAIYYYYLLRNVKSLPGENLFITSVSQLVRETKSSEALLGSISEDGCRLPGVIDRFHSDVPLIIDQVANDCENTGLFEDAVKLFDLASNHNKVLSLLNKMLSPVVAEKKLPDSKRTRLETLALRIAERYCAHGHNAGRQESGTFFLLLDLMNFFDYFHNQQMNDALDTITKLKILPFQTSEIELKVNEFAQYPEEVRRNIPDILLATMNILYFQYKDLKSSIPRTVNKFGILGDTGNKEQHCSDIRKKANCLITYSGMIPYRMPGDTNARLVQLEVMMN